MTAKPVERGAESDLHWMERQVAALFRSDEAGRLSGWNLFSRGDATPVFFLGRTVLGSLWRFGRDLDPSVVREVGRLAGAETQVVDLEREPDRLASIRERLEASVGALESWHGPAFRFPAAIPDPGPVEWLVGPDLAELGEAFPRLAETALDREPCCIVREAGELASACYAATRAGPGGAIEVGVETVAAYRGRGHALRVVAGCAAELRRRGHEPLYSTSWDNRASRAVARKLGLLLYGTDLHLTPKADEGAGSAR